MSVAYMDGRCDDASFERYLDALTADIDAQPAGAFRGVLYEAPESGAMPPTRRRALGEALKAREARLRRITAGYVMATPSAFVRGVLTAIFWVAPPPYPYTIVKSPADGFDWLGRRLPDFDPEIAHDRYQALRRRLLRDMAERFGPSGTEGADAVGVRAR